MLYLYHFLSLFNLLISLFFPFLGMINNSKILSSSSSRNFTLIHHEREYNDVGILHPDRDKYIAGRLFKFRRTANQQEIISEVLPEDVVGKLTLAFKKKILRLERVYELVLDHLVLVDNYRQHFLPNQLNSSSFVRSICRSLFPSYPRESRK